MFSKIICIFVRISFMPVWERIVLQYNCRAMPVMQNPVEICICVHFYASQASLCRGQYSCTNVCLSFNLLYWSGIQAWIYASHAKFFLCRGQYSCVNSCKSCNFCVQAHIYASQKMSQIVLVFNRMHMPAMQGFTYGAISLFSLSYLVRQFH